MRRRSLYLAAALLVLLGSGCGSSGEVIEIVVPLGTGERLDRGEVVELMPAELNLKVGDTIRIRNDDVVFQEVGPYFVAAGQEFELTYGAPGRYEGICPLSGNQPYVINITE